MESHRDPSNRKSSTSRGIAILSICLIIGTILCLYFGMVCCWKPSTRNWNGRIRTSRNYQFEEWHEPSSGIQLYDDASTHFEEEFWTGVGQLQYMEPNPRYKERVLIFLGVESNGVVRAQSIKNGKKCVESCFHLSRVMSCDKIEGNSDPNRLIPFCSKHWNSC